MASVTLPKHYNASSDDLALSPQTKTPNQRFLAIHHLENKAAHSPSDNCAICHDEMDFLDQTKRIQSLACSHVFHKECITPWAESHHSCPLCRRPIVDLNDPYGLQNRLLKAARNGEVGNLQHLLHTNAEFITEEMRGYAVLFAAERGNLDCLRALLENGSISADHKNEALILAVRFNKVDCLRALLENGPISKKDRTEAAYLAAARGRTDCLRVLIGSGPISITDLLYLSFIGFKHLVSETQFNRTALSVAIGVVAVGFATIR